VLLKAYFEEFDPRKDDVILYIQTYLYDQEFGARDPDKIMEIIRKYAVDELQMQWNQLPNVVLLTEEVEEIDMPGIYKVQTTQKQQRTSHCRRVLINCFLSFVLLLSFVFGNNF